MRMRMDCYVDYPDFLQQLIHVTVFFYGSPSGMLQYNIQHLRFTLASFLLYIYLSIGRIYLLLLLLLLLFI